MFFEGFMPARYVIPVFSATVLRQIMSTQEKAIEIYLAQKADSPTPFNPRVGVFWDDYNGKVRNHNFLFPSFSPLSSPPSPIPSFGDPTSSDLTKVKLQNP